MRKPGPFSLGFWIRSLTSTYSSVNPCLSGKAPVPIVAWLTGVLDGDAPAVACVNHAPCFASDFR